MFDTRWPCVYWVENMPHVPGVGFVGIQSYLISAKHECWRYAPVWIPMPTRLPPDDLLVLWAEVVAAGELGSTGAFVTWDEATCEKKRQGLAARPVPFPDFPFPDRVATNRLHWYRMVQWQAGVNSADEARELVRRAEEAGGTEEVSYWQSLLSKSIIETAPSPRLIK